MIAVDIFTTDSVLQADIVLPAATTTEIDGSFTNLEGRISPIRNMRLVLLKMRVQSLLQAVSNIQILLHSISICQQVVMKV